MLKICRRKLQRVFSWEEVAVGVGCGGRGEWAWSVSPWLPSPLLLHWWAASVPLPHLGLSQRQTDTQGGRRGTGEDRWPHPRRWLGMNPHRMAPGRAWRASAHLPAGRLPVQASDKGCSLPGGPELSQEPPPGSAPDLSSRAHFTHWLRLFAETKWKDAHHWFSESPTSLSPIHHTTVYLLHPSFPSCPFPLFNVTLSRQAGPLSLLSFPVSQAAVSFPSARPSTQGSEDLSNTRPHWVPLLRGSSGLSVTGEALPALTSDPPPPGGLWSGQSRLLPGPEHSEPLSCFPACSLLGSPTWNQVGNVLYQNCWNLWMFLYLAKKKKKKKRRETSFADLEVWFS